jgi:hypothetical protein
LWQGRHAGAWLPALTTQPIDPHRARDLAYRATSHIEREERPDKPIEIVRLRITEAGRRALL